MKSINPIIVHHRDLARIRSRIVSLTALVIGPNITRRKVTSC